MEQQWEPQLPIGSCDLPASARGLPRVCSRHGCSNTTNVRVYVYLGAMKRTLCEEHKQSALLWCSRCGRLSTMTTAPEQRASKWQCIVCTTAEQPKDAASDEQH